MKKLIAILMAMLMLVPAACAETKLEGEGFDSAEAAVQAYVEAFNAGDAQAMLSTFAIETYVARADREASLERTKTFMIANFDTYPMPNAYTQGLLTAVRYGELAKQLAYQYMLYSWPATYGEFDGAPLPMQGDGDAAAFLNAFDGDWTGKVSFNGFAGLNDIDPSLAEIAVSDGTLKNLSRLSAARGCDELSNLVASVTVDGRDGFMFMECCRYGDRWYNTAPGGYIATMLGLNIYAAGLAVAE